MNFSEQLSQLNELLNGLTTAENAETIAAGKKNLEAMKEVYETASKDAQDAKSALVRIVSTTPVTPPKEQDDPSHEDVPPSLDKIIEDSLADVVSARAKK